MSDIDRWAISSDGLAMIVSDGRWVKYDDHIAEVDNWKTLALTGEVQFKNDIKQIQAQNENYRTQIEKLQARNEDLEETLFRVKQWCDAYPLDIFPEPDLKVCGKLLRDGGQNIGAVSASNMRHVLTGISKIIADGLESKNE